jgi:hypothetical protein
MKRTFWFAALLGGLGVWSGFRAASHPSLAIAIYSGFAIVIGANLLLMTWLWFRSSPGSGDALVLPGLMLCSVSMLVGLLPRLYWPEHNMLGTVASILSAVLMLVTVLWWRRKQRQVVKERVG